MSAEYKEKLADPRWQKKRLDIFNRDNWTCQSCGDKTTQLEIHHIDYWAGKEPWDYPGDMLITICRNCHGKEGIRFKYEQSLINSLRGKGFLAIDILAIGQMIDMFPHFRNTLRTHIKALLRDSL